MRVADRCEDLHNCQARQVLLDEVHVSNVLANELSGSGSEFRERCRDKHNSDNLDHIRRSVRSTRFAYGYREGRRQTT